MFMKKQFNTEIDHETAQRVREKCRELDVGIGHFIRCIIVPDDVEALYEGDDLSFADIPRLTLARPGEICNDDRITARMSVAQYEVLTRYALKAEMSRSELMCLLVSQALEDPSINIIAGHSEWRVEHDCRELLDAIRGRNKIEP